jgi:ribosomal protein L11 methyltransferase
VEGTRVVDFGCGSGILGIAAVKLGARQLLCVDNDPQALSATTENAARNSLDASRLEVALAADYNRAQWQGRADIVLANILAGPLATLRDELCELLAPGATLLLAGLLDTQAEALISEYAPRLVLRERARQDEWVCLQGTLSA